jgi:hypothetical protein
MLGTKKRVNEKKISTIDRNELLAKMDLIV